ncbi:MAG: bifunctional UDP-N-acetylmuramoyl-tripeptide:D-alanyl-D-alanine ligase/alanine racemase [Bacteroidales bacterium]
MLHYSLDYIARITHSELHSSDPDLCITHVYTDSRSVIRNQQGVFLALTGKVHNGHDFIEDMYAKSCNIFWVQKNQSYPVYDDAHYIISEDVLQSFQYLCTKHREQFNYPVIGITGSNGKTIVKEWLYYLLSQSYSVIRSPKSYNSQIGVPLSLSLLSDNHDCAIIEAGISQCGEMHNLADMIQPTIGIFTNIGDAHQENFDTYTQKIVEKLTLFQSVDMLVYCADYELIDDLVHTHSAAALYAWSTKNKGNISVDVEATDHQSTYIHILHQEFEIQCEVPFVERASIENVIPVLLVAHMLGISSDVLQQNTFFPQVEMRLEQKKAINNCTLINDYYNSDFQSIKIALEYLFQQKQHSRSTVILSDVQETGSENEKLYTEICELIRMYSISRFIGIGQHISQYAYSCAPETSFYTSTEDFLQSVHSSDFSQETILLKGARSFSFERIAEYLELQTHRTVLEINLRAMIDNLNYFRSYISESTKIIVMVKAFSYGSGSYEIANILQHQRVDYLAVAFVDEGIQLRKAGISLPIIVMNPETTTIKQAFENDLEIEVYNFNVLHEVHKTASQFEDKEIGIHIKFDTGMVRYGFVKNDIEKLIQYIQNIPQCKVRSVFSHLVGTDDPTLDDFTHAQVSLFTDISTEFASAFDYHIDKHILNSAGIERFSQYQFNMVRLGIGLYGVSAKQSDSVRTISTLKTHITHIQTVETGTTIGYGRKGKAYKKSTIAVLPIGYADGLRRLLSNGVGTVVVHHTEVPIIGNICMDATMIDITNLDAKIGDEVIVFGEKPTIQEVAQKLHTIPYEIITGISQRVKRVYFYE